MASSKNKIRESRKDRIFKSICFFFILLCLLLFRVQTGELTQPVHHVLIRE